MEWVRTGPTCPHIKPILRPPDSASFSIPSSNKQNPNASFNEHAEITLGTELFVCSMTVAQGVV